MLDLPSTLVEEIDDLVAQGAFPNRDVALVELLRLGLDAFRARGHRRPAPPGPPIPPAPPGRRNPEDDRPIQPDPTDVNWAGGRYRSP